MTIANQEVLNLIVGTKYYPGGLLAKLCIKTTKEEETLYELRDTQLKNTLRQQFGKLKILDQTASIMMQCAIIIDCGNYIKNHDMTASVTSFWQKFTTSNTKRCYIYKKNKTKEITEEGERIIYAQEQCYYQAEQSAREFQLQLAENALFHHNNTKNMEQQQHHKQQQCLEKQVGYKKQQCANWSMYSSDFKKLSQKAWENANTMLEYLRNTFAHYNMVWKEKLMIILKIVFVWLRLQINIRFRCGLTKQCVLQLARRGVNDIQQISDNKIK
ncbi:Hypothetical_protein [Hexamita inflata]|uniref:Hypothetical_protein n=1 Tax=Hexamita inflata TaxID=28002 RepID=A0ABP1HDT7_9EUKA